MLNMPLSNIIMKECVINASVGAHVSDVFECRRKSPSSIFVLTLDTFEFYLEKSNNTICRSVWVHFYGGLSEPCLCQNA